MNFFEKKANFLVKKIFWPTFSRNIKHEKRHGTTYNGTKRSLASNVQAILSFPQDLKRSLKNCSKKGCFFREKRGFGLLFLVLRSKADLREQSLTVCYEVRQMLCKL